MSGSSVLVWRGNGAQQRDVDEDTGYQRSVHTLPLPTFDLTNCQTHRKAHPFTFITLQPSQPKTLYEKTSGLPTHLKYSQCFIVFLAL
ncbi:uncharacterized protein ACO6RY_13822 [Pungitius sinensis]